MKKLTILVFAATGLLISACNTMEGMGRDLQAGGKSLERAADKHKGEDSRTTYDSREY